jgi:hypothetical protein
VTSLAEQSGLLGQDESSEIPQASDQQALNCSSIEEIWDKAPDLLIGTEYVEIKDKCASGEITTAEEVAAVVEEIQAPNLSIDEQISSIANDICESLSSVKTDVDISAVEAACSAEPRDDEAVVDAASILQAEHSPKDKEEEEELEETCTSIRENRDQIEAALSVLAARSSERRLQDGSDPDETPVTSFDMATDILGMYDCLCDKSNPDNIGCMKKILKLSNAVSQSIEEQAATDFHSERILNDVEETIKKHTQYLRHSEQDGSNDATLSLARALSEVDENVVISSSVGICNPPGITHTPHNNGMKLCL